MNITLTFGINADFNERFALIVPATAVFRQLTEAHAWANTEVRFDGVAYNVAETTDEILVLLDNLFVSVDEFKPAVNAAGAAQEV